MIIYVIFCPEMEFLQLLTLFDNFWHFLTTFDNFWQFLTTNEVFWILQGARPTFCYLTSPLRGAHPSVPGGLGGFPPQSIGILRCGCFVLDFAGKNEFLKLFYVKIWNDWFLIWSNWNTVAVELDQINQKIWNSLTSWWFLWCIIMVWFLIF